MNLKNIREKTNITQVQLAELMEVDQSTVSKWEQGVTIPSITKIKKLAKILNCSVDDLLKENSN